MNSKGKQKQTFEGEIIKRQSKRDEEPKDSTPSISTQDQESMKDIITEDLTEHEQQVKAFKRNSNRLLHHRNIYVLLASVGEETMNQCSKLSDLAGYMLIRKLLSLLEWLKQMMNNKKDFPGMDYWELFIKTKDYEDIKNYI